MSSFNTFQVIIIKSHLVNNDAAALTLASFKRSHLVCLQVMLCKQVTNRSCHSHMSYKSCVAVLFYVHVKHLRSCRDGQLTYAHFSWAGLDLLGGKSVLRAHTFASILESAEGWLVGCIVVLRPR